MGPIKVKLFSNAGNYKGSIEIYPITACGREHYSTGGRYLVEFSGCRPDDRHVSTSGRNPYIVEEAPDGYKVAWLTKGEYEGVYDQLQEAGIEPDLYCIPATLHSNWKIKCHQCVVLVKATSVDESGLIIYRI